MRTLVTSRRSQTDLAAGLTAVGIEDGLAQADVIFLHRELSAQTVGFFGDDLLCHVRPGTLLVNTARKELMDAAAVRRALEQGKLGGLGLDALLEEGNPLAQLLGRADVLVTPHVSWYSERSLDELRRRTIADTISAYEENAVHRSITSGEIHDIR
jgi:lactate dehydrogenase-like 2-hydroxyacid dehydrogenase